MSPRSTSNLAVRSLVAVLALSAVALAGCGPDQRFTIANVDGAPIGPGERDVGDAHHSGTSGLMSLVILLESDHETSGVCTEMYVGFCARDAGKKLTVRPEAHLDEEGNALPPCEGAGYVPGSIHGGFAETCDGYGTWVLENAEAEVEIDGDDVHLVLKGSLVPTTVAEGTFDVDVDVVAGLGE